MNCQRDRMKTNIEGDRISSLPDDVIAKIISLIDLKQAVETSFLSSRWRFIWTKIPYIKFSSKGFSTLNKFHSFFTHVTSYCNDLVEMSLNLHGKGSEVLVQRVLNHACSHNLQQLTFTFLCENHIEFPLSLLSSQSLKHLTLIGFDEPARYIRPTSMWELPTLTTLHIECITLYDDNTDRCVGFLSNCTNLKNLTVKGCPITGSNSFTICHTQLSNLTLEDIWSQNVVKVVAPQLKNLTIKSWNGELWISAPDLTSMLYKTSRFRLSLDTHKLPSLEKVGLCISYPYKEDDAYRVVDLLQKFSHVKFLTLSLEIIEILSSSVEAIACQPSPFVNLRNLEIYPELCNIRHKRKLSIKVKNYLLDASPGATFTMVTRKEIRDVRDTKSAQNLIAELRVLLDLENARNEKKEEDKRPQPSCWMSMPIDMRKRVTQAHSYWKDLDKEIKQGKEKITKITSLVQRIKDLLIELPTSNKIELQTHLSTLCTEADTVVSKILNRMKIRFDTNESSLSVCLHQLFAAAQSSS